MNQRPPPPVGRASPANQPVARRWRPGPGGTVLIMIGPITPDGISALCERARMLLEGCETGPVACDVRALAEPDAVTIEALARLQLTARRLGHRVELRQACEELEELLVLTGLENVLPCGEPTTAASGVRVWGQSEQREQARGVEEEADPGDRTV